MSPILVLSTKKYMSSNGMTEIVTMTDGIIRKANLTLGYKNAKIKIGRSNSQEDTSWRKPSND